ncbi:carnitine transport permease protein OpuCB [Andreesenia angusta]|uniref:Carnitine transport permease protein OpuCB n=1 Tax=Andreesenia angusta TaxID=39480 RepID=A0A1S1V8G1_9FIRM|nr:ABC transporter permease [Andreesenia angusta]OHW62876.1 carnitine transport permease protein OpuCB [Andreesenia angusta]
MDYSLIIETLKKDSIIPLIQHFYLVTVTIFTCIVIGIPISIGFTRNRESRVLKTIMRILSVFQSIPSFAFIALAMPLLGIGFLPAIVALVAQSLLPIVRGAIVGFLEVDKSTIEAARGMGMSKRKVLTEVELPLAMSSILNGVKTSTVYATSAATLAGFIGAGGLGVLISRGLSVFTSEYILVGASLGAILAICLDRALDKVKNKFTY